MKLILAILQDKDSELISQALVKEGFRVTQITSGGGFLRRGSATFMIGVEDEQVDEAIRIIDRGCSQRVEAGPKSISLFVLDVARFDQV